MGLSNVLSKVFTPELELAEAGLTQTYQDFDLLAEADKMLATKEVEPPPTPDKIYRASEISEMCPREEVLRFIHQIPKIKSIDAKLRRIFDIGNAFNDVAQNRWFGPWGWLIGDWVCRHPQCGHIHRNMVSPKACTRCGHKKFAYLELEFEDKEIGISGHTDGLIELRKIRKIKELKTCNSEVYSYVNNVKRSALTKHEDQTLIYMWAWKVDRGTVVYLNKDTSDWVQFPQPFRKDRLEQLLAKPKIAREGMRDRKVPEREVCAKDDCARAKRCPVRKYCFTNK